jgi:O-antigen/teichoic acid export membrane protein
MFPYLTRLFGTSREKFRRVSEESLKYMVALVLPAAVIVSIFADRVILALYGDAYSASIPVLRILIWVGALNFVNPFLSHLLYARGEPLQSLRVAAIVLVAYLPLALFLVPRGGPSGAALALLVSSALSCGLYCSAAFKPDARSVLVTFGRTGVACASLALFLALARQIHPAVLGVGAFGVYLGVLLLVHGLPGRSVSASFRAGQ